MSDSKFPLWLPEGSVRAIIALSLLAAAIAASFIVDTVADKFLWPAAMAAVGFYFGSRGSQ